MKQQRTERDIFFNQCCCLNVFIEAAGPLTSALNFTHSNVSADVFSSVCEVKHVFYQNVSIFKVIYQINTPCVNMSHCFVCFVTNYLFIHTYIYNITYIYTYIY